MTSCRRRSITAWLAALPCVLTLGTWPQVSEAAEYLTAAAGGGGGTAFTLRCPDDQVLAGIGGRAGAVLDRVQLLCAQVDPLGRWVGSESAASATGGTGGAAFRLVCPREQAVSGIAGRAGSVVDQLRIRCGPLTSGPRLSSIGSLLTGQAGGSGGNAFGPFDCADGKPGRGLAGRTGTVVDQLRLVCDYPPAPLRPIKAYLHSSTKNGSILRTGGGLSVYTDMSSEPRDVNRIPVASSNSSVAYVSGGEMTIISNPGAMPITIGSVGCSALTVGFPGATFPALDVLVEKQGGTTLQVSPNILEWRSTTTSAFGTLTIPAAAPSGGTAIRLTSSHPTIASVPASVTIPAGSRSTTFEIRRSSNLGACIVFTASGNGVQAQSPVLFRTLTLKSF